MKITNSIGMVCDTVSWNDLQMLRHCEVMLFLNPDAIELIMEFCEQAKDIKYSIFKVKSNSENPMYGFFFSRKTKKSWHSPGFLTPIGKDEFDKMQRSTIQKTKGTTYEALGVQRR